jgi:hypothetical protein
MSPIRDGVVDPYKVLKDAYRYGRQGGSARDYTPSEGVARHKVSPVNAPADESANQFHDGKVADHNDVGRTWTRGMGDQSPHPAFDYGPSGHRYRK